MTTATPAAVQPPQAANVRAVEAQARGRQSATEGDPALAFADIVEHGAGEAKSGAIAGSASSGETVPMARAALPASMGPAHELLSRFLKPDASVATAELPAEIQPVAESVEVIDGADVSMVTIDGMDVGGLPLADGLKPAPAVDMPSLPLTASAGLTQALMVVARPLPGAPAGGVVMPSGNDSGKSVPHAVGSPPLPMGDIAEPLPTTPSQSSAIFATSLPGVVPVRSSEAAAPQISWTVGRRETHFGTTSVHTAADRLAVLQGGAGVEATVASPAAPLDRAAANPAVGSVFTVLANDGEAVEQVLAGGGGAAQAAGDGSSSTSGVPAHPAQQVFERIVGQLAQGASQPQAPAATSTVIPFRDFSQFQPLRTLEISLSPQDLGTVTLKLAVKNDMLRIEVQTASSETAGLLERDREMLASLVKSAGYQVDQLAIRQVDNAGAAPSLTSTMDPGAPRIGAPSASPQDAGFGERSAGGQQHGDQPSGGQRQPWREAADVIPATPPGQSRSVAAGIYI